MRKKICECDFMEFYERITDGVYCSYNKPDCEYDEDFELYYDRLMGYFSSIPWLHIFNGKPYFVNLKKMRINDEAVRELYNEVDICHLYDFFYDMWEQMIDYIARENGVYYKWDFAEENFVLVDIDGHRLLNDDDEYISQYDLYEWYN